MIQVKECPACGAANPIVAKVADDKAHARFLEFSRIKYGGLMDTWLNELELVVMKCPCCHHHWYRDQPEPNQLGSMYENGKPLSEKKAPAIEPSAHMLSEMGILKSFARNDRPTLLDYGSGFGRWARAASHVGFFVTAYEPSQIRGAGTTEAEIEYLHEIGDLYGRHYDAINIEQVLEHIPAPLEVLRDVRRFCDSETVVRVTVPNILRSEEGPNIWKEWPFNGRSPHTMAPFEHLHGFTPRSLQLMTKRAGFKQIGSFELAVRYPVTFARQVVSMWLPSAGRTFLLLRSAYE